ILIRAYFPFLFEKSLAESRLTKEDIASVQRTLAEAEKKMDEGCSVRFKMIRRIKNLERVTQATIDSMMDTWEEAFIEATIFEGMNSNLQAESIRGTLINLEKEALNNFKQFREKWKEIIKAHNMVAKDMVDGLGKAVYELYKNYTENNLNPKGKLGSMIRNLTRFFFITYYLNHLDVHYFKDGLERVLADPSKLSTKANDLNIVHMTEFQTKLKALDLYRGVWILKNSRNEASTKIAESLSALYNNFIQTKSGHVLLMHEHILYDNQKYPNDADKIVNLLCSAYQHHPKQVFKNQKHQTDAIKEYEKSFDRIMNPLKERHENILTLLVKIARCPQSITNKTRIAIDELLTKPIVISSIDGTDKLSIDLAREKDVSEEEMQRWIKAAFGLAETPMYHDLEKSASNHNLVLLYKDCKNQRAKVKKWSDYLVETIDKKDTKTRKKVMSLARMLDRMNTLLDCIVGCIAHSTETPEKWEVDMVRSYMHCTEGAIALISIGVYDTLANPYKDVLVHLMKEYKENKMGVILDKNNEIHTILCTNTPENDLERFYYIPENTKKMCNLALNFISDTKELIVALGPSFGANIDIHMLGETVERLGLNELQEKNFATEHWVKLSSILSEVDNAITCLKGEHEKYISRKSPFDTPNRLMQQLKKVEKKIDEFEMFIEKTKNIFLIDQWTAPIKDSLLTFTAAVEKINTFLAQEASPIFYNLYVAQGTKQVGQAYKDLSQLLDRKTAKEKEKDDEDNDMKSQDRDRKKACPQRNSNSKYKTTIGIGSGIFILFSVGVVFLSLIHQKR
ncbi:hypothetical protein NECID01_0351, partial [Nematocida sp. AWRm77]